MENKERLYAGMVTLFSTLQVFRLKLLGFHWNCKGKDFYATHLLLERLYEDVDAYIDRTAESIRKLGVVPAAMCVYSQTSILKEELTNPSSDGMMRIVAEDAASVYKLIYEVIKAAVQEQGITNLLGEMSETFDNILYLSQSSI